MIVESAYNFFKLEDIIRGNSIVIQNIKMLIYKENPILFDALDYEEELIFKEPLLFAYFNSKEKCTTLEQLLFGYLVEKKRPTTFSVYSNETGTIYLPNFGCIHTVISNAKFVLQQENGVINIFFNTEKIKYDFKRIKKIANSSFELISFQHPLLLSHYYAANKKIVAVEIEKISQKHTENLCNAIAFIKRYVTDYYKELEEVVIKMVIFNNPSLERNSFASLSVHGCIFFNAYQEDYNEVFFIEDIAHQGAHVIFNAIVSGTKTEYFKVDWETHLTDKGFFGWLLHRLEKRTLFVLMHALHTYYAILICLDAYLDANIDEEFKKHEALGRFCYTIHKFKLDLKIIERKDKNGNNLYLTDKGIAFLEMYKTTYAWMMDKRGEEIKFLKLINQPYNFTYSKFLKLNPLN